MLFRNNSNSYGSISSRLENGLHSDKFRDAKTDLKEKLCTSIGHSYGSGTTEGHDQANEDDFFLTDETTYINIIYNILNFISATNPEPKSSAEEDLSSSLLPLHLLYDRIYFQYCNIMNNINIDRFIVNNYDDIGEALDFYLVNYLSFTNLQNDPVTLSLFKEQNVSFDYCTPNLMCKSDVEDEILYIVQHHIGGIRNSQSYITNELMFNGNIDNNAVTEVLKTKLQRKRFLYLDHSSEVYWMITVDNLLDNTAVLTIMPLSLIINEASNMKKKPFLRKDENEDVFITNKLLNFMFFEKIRVANIANFTLYQYILGEVTVEEDSTADEVIVNRIIETGGFNKNYKEITKIRPSAGSKLSKKELVNSAFPKTSGRESVLVSKTPPNFSRPSSPTLTMTHQNHSASTPTRRAINSVHNVIPSASRATHPVHKVIPSGSRTLHTVESSSYMSELGAYSANSPTSSNYSNSALIIKHFMLLVSPVAKLVIFSILVQIKNQNKKHTKLVISNSWRFLLASSLFGSILFSFFNLMAMDFCLYEVVLCGLDMVLVFALLFGVLVWVL